jgi:hypothetical protein
MLALSVMLDSEVSLDMRRRELGAQAERSQKQNTSTVVLSFACSDCFETIRGALGVSSKGRVSILEGR